MDRLSRKNSIITNKLKYILIFNFINKIFLVKTIK